MSFKPVPLKIGSRYIITAKQSRYYLREIILTRKSKDEYGETWFYRFRDTGPEYSFPMPCIFGRSLRPADDAIMFERGEVA